MPLKERPEPGDQPIPLSKVGQWEPNFQAGGVNCTRCGMWYSEPILRPCACASSPWKTLLLQAIRRQARDVAAMHLPNSQCIPAVRANEFQYLRDLLREYDQKFGGAKEV